MILPPPFALPCMMCAARMRWRSFRRTRPDTVFVARKDSPLIIGLGEGENFLASDIPAVMRFTRRVVLLEDGDFAIIKKDSVTITDFEGNSDHPRTAGRDMGRRGGGKGRVSFISCSRKSTRGRAPCGKPCADA